MLRLEEEIRLLSAQLDQCSPEGLKAAKRNRCQKLQENPCNTGNTGLMWQGIQQLTGYKTRMEMEN